MKWAQFKDPVSSMCLASTMVASWSLTQEVAGSSPFTVMTNIFVTEFAEFSETFRKTSIATLEHNFESVKMNGLMSREGFLFGLPRIVMIYCPLVNDETCIQETNSLSTLVEM